MYEVRQTQIRKSPKACIEDLSHSVHRGPGDFISFYICSSPNLAQLSVVARQPWPLKTAQPPRHDSAWASAKSVSRRPPGQQGAASDQTSAVEFKNYS